MKLFCPSCGSPLEFRYDDSFVRVCGACHSAILRTDRGIDTLGKFADLAPASSGLSLGDRGHWQGKSFTLEGRAQYQHPAGGSWEEWYVKLEDGRWGWLSHAEGRWAVTFPSAGTHPLPSFEELAPGRRVQFGAGIELHVVECNTADAFGAEGEIPFAFVPGTRSRFVDLTDERGHFATIDFGALGADEEPRLFLGRQASFADLGLPQRTVEEAPAARAGERLACPHCGGSIELRVPGQSLAVVCPYCNSVLDCEGPLAILQPPREGGLAPTPITLGEPATFEGVRYTITGRMRRASTYSDGEIAWDEYLLYSPSAGYRWLVCVDGHYSFVTEVPAGAAGAPEDVSVRYSGREFLLYDRAEARVVDVRGEFYWKVTAGETVSTRDYVSAPLMLSEERSGTEVHCSLGVYQSMAEVRAALESPLLPDERTGVGANQPFSHRDYRTVALALGLAWLAVAILLGVRANAQQVYRDGFSFGQAAATQVNSAGSPYLTYVFNSNSFELAAGQNIEVDLSMPLSNSWAYVTVDLIQEESGEFRSFETELSYYSGVEGGEAWTEGSPSAEQLLPAGSGGSHQLRLEVQLPKPTSSTLALSVKQGVFSWWLLLIALGVLAIPVLGFALAEYSVELMRWSKSDFAPVRYRSSSGDGDGGGSDDD